MVWVGPMPSQAQAGAKVVVNDLGGAVDGSGGGNAMADQVVNELKGMGFEAAASYTSVADRDGAEASSKRQRCLWPRRYRGQQCGDPPDRTLLKMSDDEFDLVMKVHTRNLPLHPDCRTLFQTSRARRGHHQHHQLFRSGGKFRSVNYGCAAGIAGFTRTIATNSVGWASRSIASHPWPKPE